MVNQNRPEFVNALQGLNGSIVVIDLVRLTKERSLPGMSNYQESPGNRKTILLANAATNSHDNKRGTLQVTSVTIDWSGDAVV